MERIIKTLWIVIVFFMILTGCNKDNDEIEVKINASKQEYYLEIGEEVIITYNVVGQEGAIVNFSSSDETVVTIDEDGKALGIDEGVVTITISLEEDPNIFCQVEITVEGFPLTMDGPTEVYIGEVITLIATDRNNSQNEVLWESLNPEIAMVDRDGNVTGVAAGTTIIKIYSLITADVLEREVNIIIPEAESVEIEVKSNQEIVVLSEVKLTYNVIPLGAKQEVTWTSSNEKLAIVDQKGVMFCFGSGSVDIVARTNNGKEGKITLEITVDPILILRSFNVENPIAQYVTTYGNTEKTELVYGSVSRYYPGPLNLKENIIKITDKIDGDDNPYVGVIATQEILNKAELKTVRSGIIKPSISSIVYHDTGNNGKGANATSHANYIVSSDNFNSRARSWHYTVDDKEVIQHLPDNEVAWQGDTYLAYSTTIGIETCVDEGSNLYTTWHRTAKLMATLLKKYQLEITDIKQHYDFSQKECPQTLRRNKLYSNAISLIEAEYLVLCELEGYTITFSSNDLEYVDNYGRIIKLDSAPKRISYMVTITNNQDYNKTILFYSTLPAQFQ